MKFEVEVEPTVSWADVTFVGNLITEILSRLGTESVSFRLIGVKVIGQTE